MNWIAVVIDLVLVGIVALCAWRGWKQGIIVGALSIAGIVACICVGSIMATAYAEEFSAVPKSVGAGLVDSVSTKLLTADYSNVVEGEDDDLLIRLTDQQKKDVFSVSYATCRQLGLADAVSQKIANEAAAQTSAVGAQLSATLSNINDANIINSPYYYLQQNDIVYVEPNKVKSQNSSVGSMTTLWFSATSILISLTSLLYNILKK